MTQSVPSPSEVQATFVATLADEWIRCGLRDVVVCPGSRSTPMALAVAARKELRVHVRIDERSAGFYALGRALSSRVPVAIVVTSGTAAAELHACVAEADLAGVPLIVVTADRPNELHHVGAPQTMNQRHLYGDMVRLFEEPGVARVAAAESWRPLANRLWAHAADGERPGPVHFNAAFVEPLVATAHEIPEGRPDGAPWRARPTPVAEWAETPWVGEKILAIVGRGTPGDWVREAVDHDWVVIGDATVNHALAHADALLRSDAFAQAMRPDVVVRLGGLATSKIVAQRWREWGVTSAAFEGAGRVADPDGLISFVSSGWPNAAVRGDENYAQRWRLASRAAEEEVERLTTSFDEMTVARLVVSHANERGVALVLGSSMPIRDVEWWAPPRRVPVFSNRGVSGIDGVVSTALGVASGSRAVALIGDLTMLHDVSALVDSFGSHGGALTLVVVDNGGGGIFSFLPQSQLDHDQFEELFGTPRYHQLEVIIRAFGHVAQRVSSSEELIMAFTEASKREGLNVIIATVPPRHHNVQRHQTWNDAVTKIVEALW